MGVLQEVAVGIKKTVPYILSHHTSKNLDKCYSILFLNTSLHLCSRCLGIYAGVLLGLTITTLFYHASISDPITILLLPFPALTDWALTTFTRYNSNNKIRSFTGIFLGAGYVFGGTALLLGTHVYTVLSIGALYLFIVSILLRFTLLSE